MPAPTCSLTGRTLFGAYPPKGHELDYYTSGWIPERILAWIMASRPVCEARGPDQTRHNEVAPNQYVIAPIFENSISARPPQLTM